MQWFITGIAGGLGSNLAGVARENGHDVIGISRSSSNATSSNSSANLIFDLHGDSLNEEAASSLFRSRQQSSILALCAASTEPVGDWTNFPIQKIEQSISINVTSQLNLIKQYLNRATDGGSQNDALVLFISSGAAHRPIEGLAVYCMVKAAMEMMIRCLAVDFNARAHFLTVIPGVFESGMQQGLRARSSNEFASAETFRGMQASGALKTARRTAEQLFAVANDFKRFTNGSIVNLDQI